MRDGGEKEGEDEVRGEGGRREGKMEEMEEEEEEKHDKYTSGDWKSK